MRTFYLSFSLICAKGTLADRTGGHLGYHLVIMSSSFPLSCLNLLVLMRHLWWDWAQSSVSVSVLKGNKRFWFKKEICVT